MARRRNGHEDKTGRLSVRQYRPGDAAAASAVMVAAFRAFLPARGRRKVLEGLAPDRLDQASTGAGAGSRATYVAAWGGRVVGYARGEVSDYGVGTLTVIGVDPDCFHRGVGSALMRKMLSFWRRRGMRKVSTCVSAHNSRAVMFYLKHGFRPVGYRKDHFLVGMDEILLDLHFPEGRSD